MGTSELLNVMERLHLIGLDFGSTTSSAIVATARIERNRATGRMALAHSSVIYRSELIFTPFLEGQIDEQALGSQLDRWVRESQVAPRSFAGGGVIITGLAAQKANVAAIEALVKQRIGDALFATADDPCLESWLAFMGSCACLSRADPHTHFLNVDIGGGTTNLALGVNGEVLCTGCLFAGARHFQFVPGTYRITSLSSYAVRLLGDLKIDKTTGQVLSPHEVRRIVDFYVALTEASICGDRTRLDRDPFRYHEQIPFRAQATCTTFRDDCQSAVITLSGGVAELVYQAIRGRPLPATTRFGDLGIDLAHRLLESPLLSRNLHTHVPLNFGHATVYGLTLYSTEVSGSTLYLPDPGVLPLRDMPILARFGTDATDEAVRHAIGLVSRSARGGCVEITGSIAGFANVKKLSARLATAMRERPLPPDRTLVLFTQQNVGKTIGSYATDWGRLPVSLVVIDELAARQARFASLGAMRDNVVPVSFYRIAEE